MDSSAGGGVAGPKKDKNPFLGLDFIEQVNKRINKNFGLFENYQINPYTYKKTLNCITEKIGKRPPLIPACEVPGYDEIRESFYKNINTPVMKYREPQTEAQRYGFFPPGTGSDDAENYDERFNFRRRTSDFIHTHAMIRAYDKLMGGLAGEKK